MIYSENDNMPNSRKAKEYSNFAKDTIKKYTTVINKEIKKAVNDNFQVRCYFKKGNSYFSVIPSQEEFSKITYFGCEAVIELNGNDDYKKILKKLKTLLPKEFECVNLPYKFISIYIPKSWIESNIK